MITAIHALLYSEDPPTTRAFLRDVLEWPFVENVESGPGWLIFRSGPSEMGVHPNSWTYEGQTTTVPIHHEISLICDDLPATMKELSEKGAEFSGEPVDYGYGLVTNLRIPAAGEVQLYQPNYQPSYDLPSRGIRRPLFRRIRRSRRLPASIAASGAKHRERSERSNQTTL
jgi:predicted enzyme related to lactoylglutathione lyase